MDRASWLSAAALSRGITRVAVIAVLGWIVSGCGGSQVDKYTVTDADRKAAAPVVGADGQPIPLIKKDNKDTAAYGPDGKPMGSR